VKAKTDNPILPIERVTQSILVLRGRKVLLNVDLAALYGVTTRRFNEQVRRNLDRFPPDFMFRLTSEEAAALLSARSRIKILKRGQNMKYLPYAFSEHGAIMAATILNSPIAVEMSVYVVRAFVQLRELLSSNKELAKRLDELEARLEKKFGAYDEVIAKMLEAMRQLMSPPQIVGRPIGFLADFQKQS
jgi:ORF6N domain.